MSYGEGWNPFLVRQGVLFIGQRESTTPLSFESDFSPNPKRKRVIKFRNQKERGKRGAAASKKEGNCLARQGKKYFLPRIGAARFKQKGM